MKKANYIAVAALFSVIASSACSKDPEVAKREHFRNGERYVAEQKYQEAIIEFRNAIQQDPRYGEARMQLAEAYMKVNDPRNAFGEYIRAADLMPTNAAAQVKAAQFLLLAQQYEDAKARAEKALAVEPNNIDAQIAKGNALAGLRDMDAAVSEIENAIKLNPERSATYSNLGTLEMARGNRAEAEGAFRKAVEADPKSVAARLALANFLWNARRVQDAEAELKVAVAIDPNHVLANRALALLYTTTNRTAEAEPYLKAIVNGAPEQEKARARLMLANYYVYANRRDDARKILEEIASKPDAPGYSEAQVRLAGISAAEGNKPAAYQRIEETLKHKADDAMALAAKADLLLSDKRLDEALAAAQAAVKANARLAPAQFVLGRVHEQRRETDEAIAAFNEVLKINSQAHDARLQLARLSLSRNRPDDAIQFSQEILKVQPNHPDAHLILARAMLMKGNAEGAEARTRALEKAFPKSPAVQVQVGQLHAIKGDLPAARRAFEQALEIDPNHTEALTGLIALDLRAKNPAAAKARIESRVAAAPTNVALKVLAARLYVTTGDLAAAEKSLKQVIEIDPRQIDAYGMLGQIYVRGKRLDEARAEFETMAKLRPQTAVAAHTLIGIILQAQNKPDEAVKRYEQVLSIDSRAAVAANNLAYLHTQRGGNLDVALQLAQTAKAQLPDRPEVNDTLGWIYYKKGMAPLAIPAFRESVARDPKNPLYHYHLGIAYAQAGNDGEARKSLELALQLNPRFEGAADAQRVLATLKQG